MSTSRGHGHLDGFGAASANWSGYRGSKVPHCSTAAFPSTARSSEWSSGRPLRAFVQMLAASTEGSDVRDPWVTRMTSLPTTVVSRTLEGTAGVGKRDSGEW